MAAEENTWQGDDPEMDDILGVRGGYADTYVRFLRARNGNVSQACKMLVAHLRWRASFKPWKITAAEVELQARTGKVRSSGRDRHGRPVLVFDNTRENSTDLDMQLRHLVHHVQRVERKLRHGSEAAAALHPSKFILFVHLDNFSLRNMPARRQTLNTLALFQDHYPERLGRAILYRPPAIFAALISVSE